MLNTEPRYYALVGVPDEQLRYKLVKTSERVTSADLASLDIAEARFTLSLTAEGPHPHFSIMHMSAESGQLLALCRRLDEVLVHHAAPISVAAVRPNGQGAFVNMTYNDENLRLRALRRAAHSLAAGLGIGLAPEQADLLAGLRERHQRGKLSEAEKKELGSLTALGYKDWHATVANFGTALSREQRDTVNRIMVPAGASADDFNGGVEAVAVYRLAQFGTAVGEPLARVALPGK
jgi:hypothetical protein